eukprot:CAMPEP_0180829592 /NCGR_PEP_ID=MMETSP1038_2-20121128/75342_1 /TAXON_ID=632150 /ORGANISM="Azadinium spinosum, Strain 3D9" /LENGTH=69 /DNA_ID=CAMNT_0022872643 /DNA_START=200 /DNA_END=407 /DNA_ORIENTATION=+
MSADLQSDGPESMLDEVKAVAKFAHVAVKLHNPGSFSAEAAPSFGAPVFAADADAKKNKARIHAKVMLG